MKKSSFRALLTVILLVMTFLVSNAQQKIVYSADLMQLHQNIWIDILKGNSDKENVQNVLEKLNEKGQWPDIDYASKQRGDWHPATHLSRLGAMARAYQKEGSAYYHDGALLKKIHQAYNYWIDNDLQCPNWWYPEIGVPKALAPTMILLENELSKEQIAGGIKILDRAKIRMTGQNKVWLSGNVLMKSLLLKDAETIRKASASIQEELKVSLEEGIQPDGSFHQHGPQIQFGNYGLAYVDDMIKWIRILRNTPFSFDESKLTILRNYLFDGQQWIVWKNQMDISACGRQLFVDAQQGKARSLASCFNQMETLDPSFADMYRKANQYQELSGNKHFYNSDFQIQRSPEFYFSVKMCSERVIGAESCNSENIRGYYLGDGATYLYQSGKEYENIFPYWDWEKIPGTTTSQDDKELPILTASGYRIKSDFVGGVSDGKSGIATLNYDRNGVKAQKSWFSFNDMIVCLGAGISSSEAAPVVTTINQNFLNGEVLIKESSEKILPAGSSVTVSPQWILHDHTGYFFPEKSTLKLETKMVTGAWNQVALMYKYEAIQAGIFKLWVEHGMNPEKQKYAYILVPGATNGAMKKMESKPAFRVLSNDTNQQSVISADATLAGVVFNKAGKTAIFGGVEAMQPCVVMLKKSKASITLSISDPTQKLAQITIKLNGKYTVESTSAALNNDSGQSILTITLPKGWEAGKTVMLTACAVKNDHSSPL